MFSRIKNWYQNDRILIIPIPELIFKDPTIQKIINKKINSLYKKYPKLKNKICKNDKQKRNALIIIFICIFVIYSMITGIWNPIEVFASIPFVAYADFIKELSQSNNPILAYFFYLILIVGLSTFILYIIQHFITGKLEDKFLSIDGFIKWLINIYVVAISGVILKPLVVWYAYNNTKVTGISSLLTPTGIFGLITIFICMMLIPESVENIGSIYFSVPCFYLFVNLKIHYIFTFIFLVFNRLFNVEIFEDTTAFLSFVLVALMQILIEYIKKIKLYDYVIKIIQFFFTTILGIIFLPFILFISVILIYILIV